MRSKRNIKIGERKVSLTSASRSVERSFIWRKNPSNVLESVCYRMLIHDRESEVYRKRGNGMSIFVC